MSDAASERSAIIDEFGEVQRLLAPTRPLVKRESDLRKKIEGFCSNVPADEGMVLEGNVYRAIIGPRATRRTITGMKRLFDALGVSKFLQSCTFPLTKIDDLGVDTDGILVEDRSGPRTVMAVLREPVRALVPPVAGRKPRTTRSEVRV